MIQNALSTQSGRMFTAAMFAVDFFHSIEHNKFSQGSGCGHFFHLSIFHLLSFPLDAGPVLDDVDLGVGGLAVLNASDDALLPDFMFSSNPALLVEEEDDVSAHR